MNPFSVLFTIRLTHPYYGDRKSRGTELFLANQTQLLLRRRNIIFKQDDINAWSLLGFGYKPQETPFSDGDKVELFLKYTDSFFPLITQFPGCKPNSHYTLELSPEQKIITPEDFQLLPTNEKMPPGTLLHLILPTAKEDLDSGTRKELEIAFPVRNCFFEYLFISRDNSESEKKFSLVDDLGEISFSPSQRITFMAHTAYLIKSQEKIALKENYPFRLTLREKTDFGDKTIFRSVPCPVPGQFISESPDTLRKIMYV